MKKFKSINVMVVLDFRNPNGETMKQDKHENRRRSISQTRKVMLNNIFSSTEGIGDESMTDSSQVATYKLSIYMLLECNLCLEAWGALRLGWAA